MTFEPTEVSKTARGVLRVPTRLRSFTVILPKSAENPDIYGDADGGLPRGERE